MINAGRANDPDTVLDFFTSTLAPAVIRADSPRFLAWIPSAPTKASMLFDAVVSLASISGVSWIESAGAVWAENEALRFIADLAGMPASAGGTFVQGGSAANLSALAVAREAGRRRLGDDRRGCSSRSPTTRIRRCATRCTSSTSTRSSCPLVDDRLTGDALAATLESCADPDSVCAVVANAGSTNAGLVDDLAGIARICDERDLWMHVDAAYGGGALLAPLGAARVRRHRTLRLARHRSAQVAVRAARLRGAALPRSGARPIGARPARGVSRLGQRRETGGWNPGDYAYQLTRRARGLPFWFSLAVHGSDAYRDAVEQVLTTTRAAA